MNKTVLHDIQKTLNIIRNQIEAVDTDTKWAALELMLASSVSVVALAKKMAKPETKTVGIGSQILKELGLKNIRLLATPIKYSSISGFDIEIIGFEQ